MGRVVISRVFTTSQRWNCAVIRTEGRRRGGLEGYGRRVAWVGVGMEDQVKGRRLTCEAIIFIILKTYRPVGC